MSHLWEAINSKDVEMAMELIAAGEPVNITIDVSDDFRGIKPLMAVAEQFGEELCQALIDVGADINARASRVMYRSLGR